MNHKPECLEEINVEFLKILHKLGMDSTSKSRLAQKLSLSAKMNMIVSIQSPTIKEQNLKTSLNVMKGCVSLYNLYLLRSILEHGPPMLYEILKKSGGISIIENSLKLILYYESVEEPCYETNKALYKENSEMIENYDPELYVCERKVEFVTYNASKVVFSEFSREFVLEEYLVLIYQIITAHKEALHDFSIEKITRIVNMHKCYTKTFYSIIDYYAINELALLDFLFTPLNSRYHLCLVNTFFYDIYKDDLAYSAIEIMQMCEKYQKFISYAVNQIKMENQMGLKMKEELEIPKTKSHPMNYVDIINTESRDRQYVDREMIKKRVGAIVDSLANSAFANSLPCIIESLLTNPECIKGKFNETKLINEIENLKKENERLQIAVVNMDNKKIDDKKIENIRNNYETPPIIQKTHHIDFKEMVTKKMNEVTIRKPPPFAKKKPKEVNPHLAPYFKRSYYPLRWSKMCKGGNVWDDVSEAMNIEKVLQKFTINDLYCYEKKIVVKEKQPKSIARVTTVLPGKKGNAIGIALGRLSISDIEFKEMVLDYKTTSLTENMVRQLISNYPTPEEFKQLQLFKEEMGDDTQKIGRAEEFYINFIEHEAEFLEKLKAVYFKLIYPTLSMSIRTNIKRVSKIYNIGLKSNAIREFLQISLILGNVFNGSTFIGNAEGFTITSLNQFISYKGNDKEQLIIDIVNKMDHPLITDLNLLTQETLKYESVCTEVAELNLNYDRLENLGDLKLLWPLLFTDHTNLVEEIKNFNWLYGKFCKYFGEGDVFSIFKSILEMIDK